MSFSVGLPSDFVQVEAGATTPFNIEIANRTDQQDQFELSVEGLDPEWIAVPVPMFTVAARDSAIEKVFLKPPRLSESLAGTYPFVIRLRSLESGEAKTAQAVLEIKPYHHISIEVTPKRGTVSAFSKLCTFSVTVMNLGNSEHTLQLFASDPEDECAFEFEPDRITLGPGQQRDVALVSSATRRPLLANPRLNSFSATARSANAPSVVGSAQAQLEQRALISPGTLVFLLLLILLISTWLYFMPKPPAVSQLTITKSRLMVGETATVHWNADNATSVEITANGRPVDGVSGVTGSTTFTPTLPGDYTIDAVARKGDSRSEKRILHVTVEEAPIMPAAKIVEFKITPKSVSVGEVVNVRYKLNDFTVRATLSPPGVDLDIKANDKELEMQRAGKIDYTLIAYNRDGKDVRQTISVIVTEGPRIVDFKADRSRVEMPGETVRISWQLNKAIRATLDDGSGSTPMNLEPPSSGTTEVVITKTTTFTLVGYDANGKTSTKKFVVELKPADVSPTPSSTGDPPVTTGGGN